MIKYYLVIGLQIYCIYHLYKNKNQFYWFFIILLIPVLGSIIYILTQVINTKDVAIIKDEVVNLINPTKKIIDLEKKLEFSDTFQNRIDLADAYLENKDYSNAIKNYEIALTSNFQNDVYSINQLIKAYYNLDDFDKVIDYSEKIKSKTEFKKSQFFYGVALENKEQFDAAEIVFQKLNSNYSNYEERLFLAEFLIRRNKNTAAKEVLDQMISESKNMTSPNKRLHRNTFEKAASLFYEI